MGTTPLPLILGFISLCFIMGADASYTGFTGMDLQDGYRSRKKNNMRRGIEVDGLFTVVEEIKVYKSKDDALNEKGNCACSPDDFRKQWDHKQDHTKCDNYVFPEAISSLRAGQTINVDDLYDRNIVHITTPVKGWCKIFEEDRNDNVKWKAVKGGVQTSLPSRPSENVPEEKTEERNNAGPEEPVTAATQNNGQQIKSKCQTCMGTGCITAYKRLGRWTCKHWRECGEENKCNQCTNGRVWTKAAMTRTEARDPRNNRWSTVRIDRRRLTEKDIPRSLCHSGTQVVARRRLLAGICTPSEEAELMKLFE